MNSQKVFYGILVLGCMLPLTLPFMGKDVLETQVVNVENEKTTQVVANETLSPDVTSSAVAVAKVKQETVKEEVRAAKPSQMVQTVKQVQNSKPEAEIVYDGMTLDQLSAKLDKSMRSTIAGKGSLYASYCLQRGVDPYVALAITLHETGCNWQCSKIVRECNNVGGMKGSPGCSGGSYKKFNTIDDGIRHFIDNLSDNYYKKGLTTVEAINKKYASSSTWSSKIYQYINSIKSK